MLDLGPVWLDRYVRILLGEAIAYGLEDANVYKRQREYFHAQRSYAWHLKGTGGHAEAVDDG